jgi:hypothetical protein
MGVDWVREDRAEKEGGNKLGPAIAPLKATFGRAPIRGRYF